MNQLFGILSSDLQVNYCILVRSYNYEYATYVSKKQKKIERSVCELDGVKPKKFSLVYCHQ